MSNDHDAPRGDEPRPADSTAPDADARPTQAEPPLIDDGTTADGTATAGTTADGVGTDAGSAAGHDGRSAYPEYPEYPDDTTDGVGGTRTRDATDRADAVGTGDAAHTAAGWETGHADGDADATRAADTSDTADVPRLVEPPAPAQDAPRYGERITPTPTSAPDQASGGAAAPEHAPTQAYDTTAAPAYGERTEPAADRHTTDHTPTQAYGTTAAHDGARTDDAATDTRWPDQQPTQQYGQQWTGTSAEEPSSAPQYAAAGAPGTAGTAAPVYGQPNGGAWQAYDEPKPVAKKKTVGVVAFIVGLLALVLGIVAGYLFGHAFTSNAALREAIVHSSTGGTLSAAEQQRLQQQMLDDPATAGQFGTAGLAFVGGTVLGIWALVQGIIAAATRRGRAAGVFALVFAVLGLVAVFVTVGIVVTAGV